MCHHGGMAENEDWVALRTARERRELRTFALVLAARGIDSRIDLIDGDWRLLVTVDDLVHGREEIAAYERENVSRPPPAFPIRIDTGWWGVAAYLAVIWAVMLAEGADLFGWDWRSAGRLHVASVMSGELWRLVTALTLHADLAHIVANSLFGAVFGLLAGRYFGSGLAWLCIVLGGTFGNALNVLVRPEFFMSIGASTATFAAVGLAGAFFWRSGFFRQARWQRRFAPVFAAIAFFAYTGTGGENTDVVAHLTGLVAGFLIGLYIARTRLHLSGPRAQRFFAWTAIALVGSAWMLAG